MCSTSNWWPTVACSAPRRVVTPTHPVRVICKRRPGGSGPDDGVDRDRAARQSHGDAVVAVADGVAAAADGDDRDRREQRPALLRDPDPLPAAARRRPEGSEARVELPRAAGFERAADRVERDLGDAAG